MLCSRYSFYIMGNDRITYINVAFALQKLDFSILILFSKWQQICWQLFAKEVFAKEILEGKSLKSFEKKLSFLSFCVVVDTIRTIGDWHVFIHAYEKWSKILLEVCGVNTARFFKYVWPFFFIAYERVKRKVTSKTKQPAHIVFTQCGNHEFENTKNESSPCCLSKYFIRSIGNN